MKAVGGPRAAQPRGELPSSIERANANGRLRAALEDSARDPQQMADALCARIKEADNGSHTLDLTNLDEDEIACVRWMRPEAWRALGDFADATGGAGLQSVILGSGFVIDEITVSGLAELPALVSLTLPPGQPVDEDLLQQLRRFDTVQVTQLPPATETDAREPARLAGPVDDAAPPVREIAEAACEVLAAALADPERESNVELPKVINWLIEEASQVPPSHVDKLLVGFLKDAVRSGRGDLVDRYASTILNSPPLMLDPDRRLGLLMGLTLPISPAQWRPDGADYASDALGIANAAAAALADAHRAAPLYRGPPLLVRMCKEVGARGQSAPVPQEQVAMYQGICALFGSVLGSKELTSQERRTFCASTFAWSKGGVQTAGQFAMHRGNAGMAAAMLEMVSHADLAPDHKAELLDKLGVDLGELLDDLLPLKDLPDQAWVNHMLSWIEPDYAAKLGLPFP